jgi:hypothetical protein
MMCQIKLNNLGCGLANELGAQLLDEEEEA